MEILDLRQAAVKAEGQYLTADGVVGPVTWKAMFGEEKKTTREYPGPSSKSVPKATT